MHIDSSLDEQTHGALLELAESDTLSVGQHQFLSVWPNQQVRLAWSSRHHIPDDIVAAAICTETDADVLVALFHKGITPDCFPPSLFEIPKVRLRAAASAYAAGDTEATAAAQLAFRRQLDAGWPGFDSELASVFDRKLDRFPSMVSVAAITVSHNDLLADAADAHGDSDDVRVAFAEAILASHPRMLSGNARQRWIDLPGLPADTELAARLIERAGSYNDDRSGSLPLDVARTLQTAGDPVALDNILASQDPTEIAGTICAARTQQRRLAKAVIERADHHDPSGVTGFAIMCKLLLGINHLEFQAYVKTAMQRPGRTFDEVARMAATLLSARRDARGAGMRPVCGVALSHLLSANHRMVAGLCDRVELCSDKTFIEALPLRQMDAASIGVLAARDDMIGEHVRSSGDLVPTEVMMTWSVPTVKKHPEQWARLVQCAAGTLTAWQLNLLAGSVESGTSAADAIDALAAL